MSLSMTPIFSLSQIEFVHPECWHLVMVHVSLKQYFSVSPNNFRTTYMGWLYCDLIGSGIVGFGFGTSA